MSTEAAALCQSLCADTLCLFSLRPRVLHDRDLDFPLHPWVTGLWDASMGAALLCLRNKRKFSPLLLVPAWSVPLLCPSCPCTMLNPTQLTHFSLSWPWIWFISSLEVPDPWADPDFCHYTCSALVCVLWDWVPGGEGAVPAPLPVTPCPGLPSLEEQLGLAAPWKLKINFSLGCINLLITLNGFWESWAQCSPAPVAVLSHKKPKFHFWSSSQRWNWCAPCLFRCFFVLSFSGFFWSCIYKQKEHFLTHRFWKSGVFSKNTE